MQRENKRLFVIAACVAAADAGSKLVVFAGVSERAGPLLPVENTATTMGLVAGPPVLLVLVAGLALGMASLALRLRRRVLHAWSCGLVLGGAIANLADRALTGVVHDFLATPWVVVNVADLSIVAGIVWLQVRVARATPADERAGHGGPTGFEAIRIGNRRS